MRFLVAFCHAILNQDFVHFSNWLENYQQVKNQPKMSHMIFVTKMDFWRENSKIFTLKGNKSRDLQGFHVNKLREFTCFVIYLIT